MSGRRIAGPFELIGAPHEPEVSIGLPERLWDELLGVLDEAMDRSRSLEKDETLKELRDGILFQLDREIP